AVGGGGVTADGAVGQLGRTSIDGQAAAVDGAAAADRQSRDRRRYVGIDLDYAAQPAAVDRHARLRARDRLRLTRVAQLQRRARQGDHLRGGEDMLVEGDGRDSRGVQVGEGDGLRQAQESSARQEGSARGIYDQVSENRAGIGQSVRDGG